jgi:energy-coupling factor transport system permease protein
MFNVIIGQYYPGHSIIHKMDPRSKLLSVFCFVLVIFLATNWVGYGLIAIFVILAMILSKIPIRFIYRGLKPVLLILLFTFILNVLTTHHGAVLIKWRGFELTAGGINHAIFISIRLLAIVIISTLLTLSTTPIEITDGLETLLSPFKKIKFPVHEFALMMSISLRFIPTLLEETEKIMKAQSARGAEFTSGSFIQRIRAIIPLLIPLFISAFKRADDLAMAMEARGYRGDIGRTRLRDLVWANRDNGLILIVLGLAVGLVLTRFWTVP